MRGYRIHSTERRGELATQLLAKSKRAEGTSPNIIGEGYVKVVYLLTCYSKELKSSL